MHTIFNPFKFVDSFAEPTKSAAPAATPEEIASLEKVLADLKGRAKIIEGCGTFKSSGVSPAAKDFNWQVCVGAGGKCLGSDDLIAISRRAAEYGYQTVLAADEAKVALGFLPLEGGKCLVTDPFEAYKAIVGPIVSKIGGSCGCEVRF